MRERPILFSGPMVRALLEGRKTQTRRMVKPQPPATAHPWYIMASSERGDVGKWRFSKNADHTSGTVHGPIGCPFGRGGDVLWVRETFANSRGDDSMQTYYRADERIEDLQRDWKPSIHMPRWASRLALEVTRVRVERVQEMSGADAIAEGFGGQEEAHASCARDKFLATFYDLNKRAPRTENPWVWVIEFRVLKGAA